MYQVPVTTLKLSDMIGAHIEYAYTQNLDGSPDMIETGIIKSIKELPSGNLELYVVPDNENRMPKYRIAEMHLLRYIVVEDGKVKTAKIA